MNDSRRGEIATVVSLGTLIFIAVSSIVSSLFVNSKPQTTAAKAQQYYGCTGRPSWIQAPGPGYFWEADCNNDKQDYLNPHQGNGYLVAGAPNAQYKSCANAAGVADNSLCKKNMIQGEVDPNSSAWCYGFQGPYADYRDFRCMVLGHSTSQQPTPTPAYQICPVQQVGQACHEAYIQNNQQCYKVGTCMFPGEGPACSWGPGSCCGPLNTDCRIAPTATPRPTNTPVPPPGATSTPIPPNTPIPPPTATNTPVPPPGATATPIPPIDYAAWGEACSNARPCIPNVGLRCEQGRCAGQNPAAPTPTTSAACTGLTCLPCIQNPNCVYIGAPGFGRCIDVPDGVDFKNINSNSTAVKNACSALSKETVHFFSCNSDNKPKWKQDTDLNDAIKGICKGAGNVKEFGTCHQDTDCEAGLSCPIITNNTGVCTRNTNPADRNKVKCTIKLTGNSGNKITIYKAGSNVVLAEVPATDGQSCDFDPTSKGITGAFSVQARMWFSQKLSNGNDFVESLRLDNVKAGDIITVDINNPFAVGSTDNPQCGTNIPAGGCKEWTMSNGSKKWFYCINNQRSGPFDNNDPNDANSCQKKYEAARPPDFQAKDGKVRVHVKLADYPNDGTNLGNYLKTQSIKNFLKLGFHDGVVKSVLRYNVMDFMDDGQLLTDRVLFDNFDSKNEVILEWDNVHRYDLSHKPKTFNIEVKFDYGHTEDILFFDHVHFPDLAEDRVLDLYTSPDLGTNPDYVTTNNIQVKNGDGLFHIDHYINFYVLNLKRGAHQVGADGFKFQFATDLSSDRPFLVYFRQLLPTQPNGQPYPPHTRDKGWGGGDYYFNNTDDNSHMEGALESKESHTPFRDTGSQTQGDMMQYVFGYERNVQHAKVQLQYWCIGGSEPSNARLEIQAYRCDRGDILGDLSGSCKTTPAVFTFMTSRHENGLPIIGTQTNNDPVYDSSDKSWKICN